MKKILSHSLYFSVLYFSILLLDILVKLNFNYFPLRYITKPLVVVTLLLFYIYNNKETTKRHFNVMIIALSCFILGDFLLIEPKSTLLFASGMGFFIFGKVFYAFRFSNQHDFKLSRLLPFLLVCFIYILWLMNLIYDNLDDLFIPVLVYFFATIIVLQLAFLRKNDVNNLSYYLVFIGMLVSMASDSITAIKTFYIQDLAFEKISIMMFYGISQYLVVFGICKEVKIQEENTQEISNYTDASSSIKT